MPIAGDASTYGVGTVNSYIMPDGADVLLHLHQRHLCQVNKTTHKIEREALPLSFGMNKFYLYIYWPELCVGYTTNR